MLLSLLALVLFFGSGPTPAQVTISGGVTLSKGVLINTLPPPSGPGVLVPATMFGFNWAEGNTDPNSPPNNTPWPPAIGTSYGSVRNWDTYHSVWNGIETSRNVFDWSFFDHFTSKVTGTVPTAQLSLTMGIGDVPTWANGASCVGSGANSTILACDVADTTTVCTNVPATFQGGGVAGVQNGNCRWVEFVYNLAMHLCTGCNPGTSTYQGTLNLWFSTGNEFNTTNYNSTPCQNTLNVPCQNAARMQADAFKIFHYVDSVHAKVCTPSTANEGSSGSNDGSNSLNYYLGRTVPAYGGITGDYTDGICFHVYGDINAFHAGRPERATNSSGETWETHIAHYAALANAGNHTAGKPLIIDEGGWGENYQTNLGGQNPNPTCGTVGAPVKGCMNADSLVPSTITPTDGITITNASAPGYAMRSYLWAIEGGVSRFNSYALNSDEWTSFADCPGTCASAVTSANYTASPYAWQSLYTWLVGSSLDFSGIQNPSTNVYTYSIVSKDTSKPTGCSGGTATADYRGMLVWNIASGSSVQSCTQGGVTYSTVCTAFEGTSQPFSGGTAHTCSGFANGGSAPGIGNFNATDVPVLLEANGAQIIQAPYFGAGFNATSPHSTSLLNNGSMRLMDSSLTSWTAIEQSAGSYTWTTMDSWLSAAATDGEDVLWAPNRTPPFYTSCSSSTAACGCQGSLTGPYSPYDGSLGHTYGLCHAPTDVAATPNTTKYYNFLLAALNRNGCTTAKTTGCIKYLEAWNEPDSQWMGLSTDSTTLLKIGSLVKMTQIARTAVDAFNAAHSGTVQLGNGAPQGSATTQYTGNAGYLCSGYNTGDPTCATGFFGQGGAQYLDFVAFHGYVGAANPPEQIITDLTNVKTVVSQFSSLSGKPLWDTEAGFDMATVSDTNEDRINWIMRRYLLEYGQGVSRFYEYAYDNSSTGQLYASSALTKAGKAYNEVFNWMQSWNQAAPCAVSGTVYHCDFTKGAGGMKQAVWDTSGASQYTTPVAYHGATMRYYDTGTGLWTSTTACNTTNCTDSIGKTPILFQIDPTGGIPLGACASPINSNNTSGCTTQNYCTAAFTGLGTTAGNTGAQTATPDPAPQCTSTLDIHTLLPAGDKVFIHFMPWFVSPSSSGHNQTKYTSNDAETVAAQMKDMEQRHFDALLEDWYGQADTSKDQTLQKIRDNLAATCTSPQNCSMLFAALIDQGTVKNACGGAVSGSCAITTIESALCYLNSTYFGSNAYLKLDPTTYAISSSGKLAVYTFPPSGGWNTTDWTTISTYASNLAGNCPGANNGQVLLITENGAGLSAPWNGAFAWPQPLAWSSSNQLLYDGASSNYLENFYPGSPSTRDVTGGAWPGFDDANANWGSNRVIARRCGQTWLNTIAKMTSTANNIQLATWNDYEEGTEIETGIDNCYRVSTPTLGGTTLSWVATTTDSTYAALTSNSPANGTADHWAIWYCDISANCVAAKDGIPLTTLSYDLSTLAIPTGTWRMYVQLIGKPDIWNQTSASYVNYTH